MTIFYWVVAGVGFEVIVALAMGRLLRRASSRTGAVLVPQLPTTPATPQEPVDTHMAPRK